MSTATASLAAALSAKERRPHSRDFDALVRAIGECKSKAEEDAIVAAEVGVLKPRLGGGALAGGGAAGDKRAVREALIRLAYVEMLGHDASWGHVRALQACSDPDVLTKKVRGEGERFFEKHGARGVKAAAHARPALRRRTRATLQAGARTPATPNLGCGWDRSRRARLHAFFICRTPPAPDSHRPRALSQHALSLSILSISPSLPS